MTRRDWRAQGDHHGLDEVVGAGGAIHLESMGGNEWYGSFGKDGGEVRFWFTLHGPTGRLLWMNTEINGNEHVLFDARRAAKEKKP